MNETFEIARQHFQEHGQLDSLAPADSQATQAVTTFQLRIGRFDPGPVRLTPAELLGGLVSASLFQTNVVDGGTQAPLACLSCGALDDSRRATIRQGAAVTRVESQLEFPGLRIERLLDRRPAVGTTRAAGVFRIDHKVANRHVLGAGQMFLATFDGAVDVGAFFFCLDHHLTTGEISIDFEFFGLQAAGGQVVNRGPLPAADAGLDHAWHRRTWWPSRRLSDTDDGATRGLDPVLPDRVFAGLARTNGWSRSRYPDESASPHGLFPKRVSPRVFNARALTFGESVQRVKQLPLRIRRSKHPGPPLFLVAC